MLLLSRFQSNAADSPPLLDEEGEEEEEEEDGEIRQISDMLDKKLNEKQAARGRGDGNRRYGTQKNEIKVRKRRTN